MYTCVYYLNVQIIKLMWKHAKMNIYSTLKDLIITFI